MLEDNEELQAEWKSPGRRKNIQVMVYIRKERISRESSINNNLDTHRSSIATL